MSSTYRIWSRAVRWTGWSSAALIVLAAASGCHPNAADEQRAICAQIEDPAIAEQMGCLADSGVGDGGAAVDACMAAPAPAAPRVLPGTRPRDTIFPRVPAGSGPPEVFECYGVCGPSCNTNGQINNRRDFCQQWQDCEGWHHRVSTFNTITGNTHPFCRWHDECYARCSQAYGSGPDNANYQGCTGACDIECNPATSIGCRPLRWRYGHIIRRVTAPLPPVTWQPSNCIAWAMGNGSLGESDGTVTFSSLDRAGPVTAGRCPAHLTTETVVREQDFDGQEPEPSEEPIEPAPTEELDDMIPADCLHGDASSCEEDPACSWFDDPEGLESGCADARIVDELTVCLAEEAAAE